MKVNSLYPGIALKCKPGMWVGLNPGSLSPNPRAKWLIILKNMGWWDDFHMGEQEVIVYLGERRGAAGRLLREVLWRGHVAYIRPYDWRYLETIDNK